VSHDFWNDRYAEPGHAYGTEPNVLLREQAHRIERGPVLCLAAGQGRNAVFLAERGLEVEAVDSSAVGMLQAQKLAEARGVRLHTAVADLADHPIGEAAWGAVVSIFCHLPQPLRRQVHRRVVAGLRPGGVLIMEAYTPRQLGRGTGGPPDAALLYEPEDLWAELDGLDPLLFGELEREVLEGRYHTGPSAVVQLVAVKPAGAKRRV